MKSVHEQLATHHGFWVSAHATTPRLPAKPSPQPVRPHAPAKRPDLFIPPRHGKSTTNQERGSNGDVEESVVNVTVPSVSVK